MEVTIQIVKYKHSYSAESSQISIDRTHQVARPRTDYMKSFSSIYLLFMKSDCYFYVLTSTMISFSLYHTKYQRNMCASLTHFSICLYGIKAIIYPSLFCLRSTPGEHLSNFICRS